MKKRVLAVLCVCMAVFLMGCSLLSVIPMDTEDMLKLPDDELISRLLLQLGGTDFDELNESQKVVYTAAALEMEVLNGGMVQFLSNEANGAAPYICDALEKIGAADHLALLQADLEKNHVDLSDLSDFDTLDLEAFSKLYERYDFETFDGSYVELPSIPQYIRAYIQAHMGNF